LSAGTIFDIKKFAIHDGPGVRTTVFLKGCPLRCWLCHNPESQDFSSELLRRDRRCNRCGDCLDACAPSALSLNGDAVLIDRYRCDLCGACADACLPGALELVGREVTVEEVMGEIEKDRAFYDESGGGVTFSGGEPLAQPEFLADLLQSCKRQDISTVVDTCGFASREVIDRVRGQVDLFLYDLKIMDESRHQSFTGVSNQPIHENLRWLSGQGAAMVVRYPMLPGINDDERNVREMGEFLASLPNRPPIDILTYHKTGIDKYARLDREYALPEMEPPADEDVAEVAQLLNRCGLRVTVRGEEI
jgi:pyruvate formate lyase activating enzyme